MGLVIGRTPAFEPMVPGPWPTAAALVLTLATAFAGGAAARWLADILEGAVSGGGSAADLRAAQAYDRPADRVEKPVGRLK